MPERFDDLPVLAGLGASLRGAMAAAELAEAQAPAHIAPQPQAGHGRRWRARRPSRFGALSTVLVLGVVSTAAAAATLTLLRGSPIPAPRSADLQPAMTVRADTAAVIDGLRAADPSGRNLPFALRTATSAGGLTCATVGQVDDGDFGLVGTDGRFRELPAELVDACGTAAPGEAAVAGARVLDAKAYEDVRSVVYGLAGEQLRSAELVVRGKARPIPVKDGAFLAAVAGYPEDSRLLLKLTFADGKSVDYPLGRNDSGVLDPTGPAWSVFSMGISVGEREDQNFSCVDVRPARHTPGRRSAATPPVCTHEPRRRSERNRGAPWYFDARSFGPGDHGRDGGLMTAWRWPLDERRTVIWGAARRDAVARILVMHRGKIVARPRRGGGNANFAAVLPADLPPRELKVVLKLRDGSTKTLRAPANVNPLPEVTR